MPHKVHICFPKRGTETDLVFVNNSIYSNGVTIIDFTISTTANALEIQGVLGRITNKKYIPKDTTFGNIYYYVNGVLGGSFQAEIGSDGIIITGTALDITDTTILHRVVFDYRL